MAKLPLITLDAIQSISTLKDPNRIIFFLTMRGDDKPSVAIKLEPHASRTAADKALSLKWSAKMMQKVNEQQLRVKIMTDSEVRALKARVLQLVTDTEEAQMVNRVCNRYHPEDVWIKMPYISAIKTAGHLSKNVVFSQNPMETPVFQSEYKITELLAILSKESNWYQLGRVIAVDLFNGNSDRFHPVRIGETIQSHWENKGNLVYAPIDGRVKILGLDAYDAVSRQANLAVMPTDLLFLDVLKNVNAQETYAASIVTVIAKTISDKMFKTRADQFSLRVININNTAVNKYSIKQVVLRKGDQHFLLGYVDDLKRGLQSGAADLKNYLIKTKNKYEGKTAPGNKAPTTQKNFPPAIAQRMKYLGWIG